MSTPSSATIANRVAGTRRIVSAQAEVEVNIMMPFGPNPIGLLIFTEDLHRAETIVNPRQFWNIHRGRSRPLLKRAFNQFDFTLTGTVWTATRAKSRRTFGVTR